MSFYFFIAPSESEGGRGVTLVKEDEPGVVILVMEGKLGGLGEPGGLGELGGPGGPRGLEDLEDLEALVILLSYL